MQPESAPATDTGSASAYTGTGPVPPLTAGGAAPAGIDHAALGPRPTPTTAAEPARSTEPGGDAQPTALDRLRGWFLFLPLVVYVVCRVVTLVGLVIVDVFTHKGLGHNLRVWDGKWFVAAAVHGWVRHLPMHHGHVAGNTIAFFPVFPLTIRWTSDLTRLSPVGVGTVISGVTGLTAVLAVGLLAREYVGESRATRAALLFAVFPGTFVFSLIYSEGIVITCVAFGLLALLRKQWWLAGVLGLVATGTSPIALAFVASCAWCAGRELLQHRNWRALIAPVLAPLGFIGYMVWLWRHTGVLSAWRLTERGGWQSYPSLVYPIKIVTTFLRDPIAPTETGQLLFFGTIAAVIGVVFIIRERPPAPVLLYGLIALGLAAVSAPVGLRPRFLMLAFPLVIAVGTRLSGRPYRWVVAGSAVLLLAMTIISMATLAVFP
jgi:hypothetical protein